MPVVNEGLEFAINLWVNLNRDMLMSRTTKDFLFKDVNITSSVSSLPSDLIIDDRLKRGDSRQITRFKCVINLFSAMLVSNFKSLETWD